MQQRLKSKHLGDMTSLHFIITQHMQHYDTKSLEDALRNIDAIWLFEILQHLIAVKLFSLRTSIEVSLSGFIAAVRENNSLSAIIE